ncbi:Phosphotransferase enzyme family protein [Clostridium cavendishii DSM 21758]|uniref:Phosphotransferase enzyme family protein n=1 Tax=Clostridium cavendishii DSM 21758 TaxID=1121302 RepID=A0A1M6NLD8_9CLOT|nr:phosphotransferase [Clostridium cavendishii]SHJ96518.1 Phosphotransferase enzyme family protein [Clostridium cavendishii DSM 21758]
MNETSRIYKALSNYEINKIIKNYFGKETEFKEKLISGGMFNTTYHIEIPESKEQVILRVGPINKHLILPFELNLMEAEEYVYKLCSKQSIPCSQILLCDTEKKIIDRDYMIVKYIDSKVLSEVDINNELEEKIYSEVGSYIAKLHNITSDKFGRVYEVSKGKGFDLWSEYLLDEFLKLREKVEQFNIFSIKELNLVEDIINKYKNILDEIKVPHLIHGDLWAGNILVQAEEDSYKLAAIIDADRAIFGDIDFEFASSWIINQPFLRGYGKGLSDDIKRETRRKIYKLIYTLIDTYVWIIEYDKREYGLENKAIAIKLINELLE